MFFSVSRLEHGEKCHLMKVVKKIPTSPQNRDRPALPYRKTAIFYAEYEQQMKFVYSI